jgi:PAS domain S-box-containing protein
MVRTNHWSLRYGIAVAAVVWSTASMLLVPVIGRSGVAIPFFAVLISAWFGGLGPGAFTTALCLVLYLIVLVNRGSHFPPWQILQFALFVAGGALITGLVEALHAARRRAEESRRSLSAVLISIGDAVIATDTRGRVTFMNPVASSLTGWAPEEAAGKPLAEVFSIVNESTRQSVEDPVVKVLRDGVIVGLANHTVLIARDGREWPVHDSAAPIRDAAGEIIGAVLVFRDDTERREYERRLLESARRKDEFLAMLGHELRNPLGAIKSAVSILETPEAEGHHAWGRDVLNHQVDHLSHLLDDLLDVARIARGRVVLRKEMIDVDAVIRHAVESVRHLFDERNHRLAIVVSPGMRRLEADPVRLEQVLVNLLNNAAKYTPTGGRIGLSARVEGDQVVIRVEDNGSGISRERLPTIFEPFAQGERTLARTEGGLGIGLTIVTSLVELHGGSVRASSPGPGLGSVFTMCLPVPESPSPEVEMLPASRPPLAPPPRYATRILIIDDNRDLAHSLARLLKYMGYEVETAHDGPDGIEAALAYGPDVLLLDIGLPNLDGYEVARRLRRVENLKRSLFIAISGYGHDEDRRRSWEAGIDHHLAKPVDIRTIAGLIEQPR